MPFKRQHKKQNAGRAAFIEFFKKRRLETSFIHNLLEPNIDDDKLDITDTSLTGINDKEKTMTWFWNKSANKIDLKKKKEDSNNMDEKNLEKEQSEIK